MSRRAVAALLVPALSIGLVAAAAATASPAAGTPRDAARLPVIYPIPQSMQAHGGVVELGRTVALVVGSGSDPAAIDAAETVLRDAGVSKIDKVSSASRVGHGVTAVYVGGPEENPAAAEPLSGLHVEDASALPTGGYVLADGVVQGRSTIVLDGRDGTGTFYAVQTLRQLIERHHDSLSVPGVRVRDWPAQALRGVIEGFYGTPWSDEQRLAQMDYYGAHKMNIYVYSPKDDAYLRAQWRDPYPAAQLDVLKKLVARATANHVQFTYALSPGLSVCYSSAADEQALVAKFQTLWDIGVRSFSIPLDDISYTKWNCAADQSKFGSGGGAAGAAQAYLLNAVQKDFIATHPGAERLQMVPTEYYDVTDSPYKTAIRTTLDPAIVVGWTGVGVVTAKITAPQAKAAETVFGHDILLWDNFPVNDYATDRLLLGPYAGRAGDLSGALYGITANPMIEPVASETALFSVADYTWNGAAFDANASWRAGLVELAGADPRAQQALAAFADLEYYSQLDPVQAPTLAAKTAAFWSAWEAGDTRAAAPLDAYLKVIQWLPSTLATTMDNPEFVSETQPWLDSASAWGVAARAALQMLVDQRAGRGAAALTDRAKAQAQQAKARSYTYAGLGGTVHVTVGDGVLDTFIANALAENDRWLGVAGRHVTATTSLPTYQSYAPANMVDGQSATYFWSSAAPSVGDYVGVDLGATRPITGVKIQAGDTASPSDYLHAATLEYSSDAKTWATAGSYANAADITATLPAGTSARYVRLRATQADSSWVKVHEFAVTGAADDSLTVTGSPAPVTTSSLAAAADGNVDTSYLAASAPAAGETLTATLPNARPLDTVAVVGTGRADVLAEVGGSWHRLGKLSATGYTELRAGGLTVSAVRLEWLAGSPAPTIAEIVPWYSDTAAASLTAVPASVDTAVGTPVPVSVSVGANQPRSVSGTLRVEAPAGVQAQPGHRSLIVGRGTQQSAGITVRADTAGTYEIPVTFTPRGGAPVSTTISVTAHPPVSSTDVALTAQGAIVSASSVEQNLPQFTPDHAVDGDLGTRWSSGYTDGEWLQVKFAQPQNLGKVVVHWEAAHATAYKLQSSSDGTNWTTAATVTDSPGGTETEWIDQSNVSYLRLQGVTRSSGFGYSVYELQVYPTA